MPNRSLSTTVTELRSSVAYRFRLRAVIVAGASDWQQFTGTSGVVVPNPPATPVVRLSDDPEQLTVIWAEPDNGGVAIDRYQLRNRAVGIMSWTPLVPGNLTL